MKNRVLLLALAAFGLACAAQAQVSAVPGEILISKPDQKVAIALAAGGKPVAAADITGYTFNVEKHTYEFMITLETQPGGVIVTPTDRAESGEYDLTINTRHGAALIKVKMPLDEAPDSIEQRAEGAGMTVEEMKAKLGISKPVGRETITFTFPESYHVGQKIEITVPCPEDRAYECKFNGELIHAGSGPEKFEYTFEKPGEYTFEYRESKDGQTLAVGSGKTTVYEKSDEVKK